MILRWNSLETKNFILKRNISQSFYISHVQLLFFISPSLNTVNSAEGERTYEILDYWWELEPLSLAQFCTTPKTKISLNLELCVPGQNANISVGFCFVFFFVHLSYATWGNCVNRSRLFSCNVHPEVSYSYFPCLQFLFQSSRRFDLWNNEVLFCRLDSGNLDTHRTVDRCDLK